ncbi:MAG: LysR family transcriptional regulator [Bacteroidales bacterium]|nr:LysR family transcriptional regulator [Candidatus Cryptobacteroides equifaecalis]
MTLQQLEYIISVAEYGHFGKAADACGVTQPTLSLMIKKLEEELDVVIFDRDSHPVNPTVLGQKVIDKARVVLFNTGQLVELTRSEKSLASGEVKIAMISTVAPVLTPGLFRYLCKTYPQVHPQVQEMLSDSIIRRLKKAELDMGIVVSPVKDPDLMEIPLFHEKFLAYVSPDYPLYAKTSLESKKLLNHPIWIMKDGLRQFDKSMLAEGERFSYDKMYEGGRAGTLIFIVNEIGGMTIIPELHRNLILYSMQENLRPIVNPELSRKISLVIRKDYVHERMLNIVIEAVRNTIPLENQEDIIKKGNLIL